MRIMSLNLKCGDRFPSLMQYLEHEALVTDVFCLQEVYDTPDGEQKPLLVNGGYARTNMYHELCSLFTDHVGYFAVEVPDCAATYGNVDFPLQFGLATFVHKNLTVRSYGDGYIHSRPELVRTDVKGTAPRKLAHITLEGPDELLSIAHFRGLWNGRGKDDTPERIQQSRCIDETLTHELEGQHVLVGDFNLTPDTHSFAILASRRRDLIAEYKIPSTRSRLYAKYETGTRYADYALVTPSLKIKSFQVPYMEVSDHLPLILEIS